MQNKAEQNKPYFYVNLKWLKPKYQVSAVYSILPSDVIFLDSVSVAPSINQNSWGL